MNIKEELIKIPNLINNNTLRVNGNIFRKEEYQILKKEIEVFKESSFNQSDSKSWIST